jgi:hypothetical protein
MLLLAAGCMESNPQPSPAGQDAAVPHDDALGGGGREVDEEKLYSSAPDDSDSVIVVGDKGAAEGAANCFADSDDAGAGEAEPSTVNEDGSFVIVVSDVVGPTVRLVFKYPDTLEELPVEVPVPIVTTDDDMRVWLDADAEDKQDEDPNGRPAEYDGWAAAAGGTSGGITASAVADGQVEVVGAPFSATPLSMVIVVNLSLGSQAIEQANNVGEFLVTLPGNPGDGISVFASNPGDHGKATVPVSLTVPD